MCINSVSYFLHTIFFMVIYRPEEIFILLKHVTFNLEFAVIGFGTNVLPNSEEDEFRLADMIWADVEQQPHSANEAN